EEIYVMNADGTRVTNLTNYPGEDITFSWLPDGRIMFSREIYETFETYIYVWTYAKAQSNDIIGSCQTP
ncbi:MAG TPA: hypothetical protein VIH30_05415, partial [Aquirhabdus sp.]